MFLDTKNVGIEECLRKHVLFELREKCILHIAKSKRLHILRGNHSITTYIFILEFKIWTRLPCASDTNDSLIPHLKLRIPVLLENSDFDNELARVASKT